MAKFYLLGLMAVLAGPRVEDYGGDYSQEGAGAEKFSYINGFPWQGEISIRINVAFHFYTCLLHIDKLSAVCVSGSEDRPCHCSEILF